MRETNFIKRNARNTQWLVLFLFVGFLVLPGKHPVLLVVFSLFLIGDMIVCISKLKRIKVYLICEMGLYSVGFLRVLFSAYMWMQSVMRDPSQYVIWLGVLSILAILFMFALLFIDALLEYKNVLSLHKSKDEVSSGGGISQK